MITVTSWFSDEPYDRHVADYRRIERNAGMVLLSAFAHLASRPAEVKNAAGFNYRVSEAARPDAIYFIPKTDSLIRIHEQDPMEDLRRYFGCIRNVTA